MLTHRRMLVCLVDVLFIAAVLEGCTNQEAGEVLVEASPSPMISASVQPTVQLTVEPTVQPVPTRFVLGPLFDPRLDLRAGPVDVALDLQIPLLKVDVPVLGVGLNAENQMDAPKGPIDDPVWQTAFWYRNSGKPGEPGTATIAGHVDDPLGRPEIFAHLQDLHAGDLIIIHVRNTSVDIPFMVDQVEVYSTQESSDPAVLTRIFGAGPAAGAEPQPALDGLSHLTLITCSGNIVNGEFDHHRVVYATRSK
jgi:hypothetical protein